MPNNVKNKNVQLLKNQSVLRRGWKRMPKQLFFSLKQREELSLHRFSVKKYMPFSARGMLFLNTGARATEFLSKLQRSLHTY